MGADGTLVFYLENAQMVSSNSETLYIPLQSIIVFFQDKGIHNGLRLVISLQLRLLLDGAFPEFLRRTNVSIAALMYLLS